MVYYALETLAQSGITEILVISTLEHQSLFQCALGDGSIFNVNLTYACQDKPEGIAQAIMIGQDFVEDDDLCLITGDTIIVGNSLQKSLIKADIGTLLTRIVWVVKHTRLTIGQMFPKWKVRILCLYL